jgi:AbrB family looped-hinge helix DNA binding protein
METTKVSPKYQVVIPQRVREAMDLKPGTRLQVVQFEDRIEADSAAQRQEPARFPAGAGYARPAR